MTIRMWFPSLAAAALALSCLSTEQGQAGSFFGPSCYGADYAYQYPNRANNVFGCGPGTTCTARHPLFKHRWLRRHQGAAAGGAPVNAMPVESMAVPVVPEAVHWSPAVQTTSIMPAPVATAPAASGRIAPMPAPMPSAPVSSPSAPQSPSSKPPF
jgi:hypothetical protein